MLLLSATTDYRPQGLQVLRGIGHDLLEHSPVLDRLGSPGFAVRGTAQIQVLYTTGRRGIFEG